jgi:hypothetical protein
LLFFALALDTLCLAASSNSEEELRGGAEEFITLIEARDQTALLSLISEQGTDISKMNGKVSVLLSLRAPDAARLGEDALNFYFRLEDGKWNLRNVEYN